MSILAIISNNFKIIEVRNIQKIRQIALRVPSPIIFRYIRFSDYLAFQIYMDQDYKKIKVKHFCIQLYVRIIVEFGW